MILSFGGSLGARNQRSRSRYCCTAAKTADISIFTPTEKYGDWFPDLVKEKERIFRSVITSISDHTDNMPTCGGGNLVICRAGAITLSEIQAMANGNTDSVTECCGKPSVPQRNGSVNAGAAEIIEESELSGETLMKTVDKMLLDPEKLNTISENSRKMAITDANERIYRLSKNTRTGIIYRSNIGITSSRI